MALLYFVSVNKAIDYMNFTRRTIKLGDMHLPLQFSRHGSGDPNWTKSDPGWSKPDRDARPPPPYRGRCKAERCFYRGVDAGSSLPRPCNVV